MVIWCLHPTSNSLLRCKSQAIWPDSETWGQAFSCVFCWWKHQYTFKICCYANLIFPLLFFLLPLVFPFKTLEASGLNVTMEDVANTDHFSIIEKLVDGEYHLTKVNMQTKPKLLKIIMNVSAFFFFFFNHSPCLSKLYEINILY